MKMYVAMQDALLLFDNASGEWQLKTALEGKSLYCLTVDPHQSQRVYCGTFGEGLWISNDAGIIWRPAGQGITSRDVTAVAVSQAEKVGSLGAVWVGTEPSALFYSTTGGETWEERPTLLDLPSRPTWMFPPRPYTHHVRWIQPDLFDPARLFVGIEMGGVMRSLDKGVTWEDRKPGSQLDAHALRMHPQTPDRIYEASGGDDPEFHHTGPLGDFVTLKGGGYAESTDGGVTWATQVTGLEQHHYLWSVAIDSGDPNTLVASAAVGPQHAHELVMADSYIYRRTAHTPWQRVHKGLPTPQGTLISEVSTLATMPGIFYLANNHGVYRSSDAGNTWEQLPLPWPTQFSSQHVQAFVITE